MNFSAAPITFILIAINVIVSLIGFSNADVIDKTIMWPYGIKREKQYYRFITSGFIHADFIHLLFNMFSFYYFGSAIEFYFAQYGLGGNISYLLLYFLALIIADIPSYLFILLTVFICLRKTWGMLIMMLTYGAPYLD